MTVMLKLEVMAFRGGSPSVAIITVLVLMFLLAAQYLVATAAESEDCKITSTDISNELPESLEVPKGYKAEVVVSAKGHQYYTFNGSAWVNNTATAWLYLSCNNTTIRNNRKVIGRHFYLAHPDRLGGQPSWETLPKKIDDVPYSLVTAKAVSRVTVDEDSITWVLLNSTNSVGDKEYFGEVKYVLRYDTHKGLPPSVEGACMGQSATSAYTAKYAFYVPA